MCNGYHIWSKELQTMCNGYHIWSRELLMQAKNDEGHQRSNVVNYVLRIGYLVKRTADAK